MWHDAIMLGIFAGVVVLAVPFLVDRLIAQTLSELGQGIEGIRDDIGAYMTGHSQSLYSGFSDVHEVLDKHSARLEAAVTAAENASKHTRMLAEVAGSAEMCSFCGLIVSRFEAMQDGRICCENCKHRGAGADA